MKKFKVKITKENFKAFVEYYNADKERVKSLLDEVSKLFYTNNNPVYDKAREMFDRHFMNREERKNTFSLQNENNRKLQILVEYTAEHDLTWNVVEMKDKYLYLCFSGNYIFWTVDFCELIELPDYDAMSMTEVKGLIGNDSTMGDLLPAEMNALSINCVNEEKDALSEKQQQLKKKKDDIRYCKTEELSKMENEIQKLRLKLSERKEALLAELHEKEAELQAQMDQMNKQIYMMEAEIYVIRSYSGETIELNKIRSGKMADKESPLIINQKLMYLDEDIARIVSIYQHEISHQFSLFSDAVAGCDEVFDAFCPQERCLTFFRLSKNASYRWYNGDRHMYETEDLIHGKKMGFLLRDGECAYIGWLDESWRTASDGNPVPVTFTENLMYKPGEIEERELTEDESGSSDSTNTMLSRAFAMSVVQGILDNRGLLHFPEKVSVTRPGRYIKFNYATGWIMDDRFGDFATLVDNLNKRTKLKDQILICYKKDYCLVGHGEGNRTYDCEVPEGLNRVNFLESDEYGHCKIYVSAKKRYSLYGATANILCKENEYINITYMNSIWLKYYVQTKKMGRYAEDYAKMVKHFKRAIEVITEREAEEMTYIKKYYPDADQISEWQVLLSHWKLNHHIRFINDFQAKRIAKYLEAGNYKENAHLFEKEEFYNVDTTADGIYQRTQFGWISKGWGEKPDPEGFGRESAYYYENFYLKDYDTNIRYNEESIREQTEKNAEVIAKDLPKLEALVPERMKKDEEKLTLVKNYVMEFLTAHGVRVSDLTEESRETALILDDAANKITFKPAEELGKEERQEFFAKAAGRYLPYILQSECWKVAYNDYLQNCFDRVLHDAKMILHNRFMNDIK